MIIFRQNFFSNKKDHSTRNIILGGLGLTTLGSAGIGNYSYNKEMKRQTIDHNNILINKYDEYNKSLEKEHSLNSEISKKESDIKLEEMKNIRKDLNKIYKTDNEKDIVNKINKSIEKHVNDAKQKKSFDKELLDLKENYNKVLDKNEKLKNFINDFEKNDLNKRKDYSKNIAKGNAKKALLIGSGLTAAAAGTNYLYRKKKNDK